jgi:hypothetical protein
MFENGAEEGVLLRHLYKNDDLPRQARDKHRESTQKKAIFRTALSQSWQTWSD